MYGKFTDRCRKVMQLANQEAQKLNHEYIGTEHILLGLLREGGGTACNVLKNLDFKFEDIQREIGKLTQAGPLMVTMGKLPQTPRAKKVIEYAMEQACEWKHNYVGTEHVLCGLIREHEGIAGQVLINLGLSLADVREETLHILGHGMPERKPEEKTAECVAEAVSGWAKEYKVQVTFDDESTRRVRIANAQAMVADGQRELALVYLGDARKENRLLREEIERLKAAVAHATKEHP